MQKELYKKITPTILAKIKLEYEYGRDLKAIALDKEYQVSYETLKKRKLKDEKLNGKWIKGSKANISYSFINEEHEVARQEALSLVMTKAKDKIAHMTNIFNSRAKDEQRLLLGQVIDEKGEAKKYIPKMAPEIAYSTKLNSTEKLIELERKVVTGFMTTEELQILKFNHDKRIAEEKLALEKEKLEIDTTYKAIGLELKHQEALNDADSDTQADDGLLKALGVTVQVDWSDES